MPEGTTMNRLLTMLIPVKDRPEYTIRVLRYLNRAGFRGSILIADGSIEDSTFESVQKFSANTTLFLKYKRYPPDLNYEIYMDKMMDAFETIETPYVVWATDDDFYDCELLYSGVNFLECHPNYSAWGAETLDFRVRPRSGITFNSKFASGTMKIKNSDRFCGGRYENMSSIAMESAQRRLNEWSNLYPFEAVHRVANWRTTIRLAKASQVYDYRLILRILKYITLIQGSFHYCNEIFLLRQSNTDTHEGANLVTLKRPSDLHFIADASFMRCIRAIDNDIVEWKKSDATEIHLDWLSLHLSNSLIDYFELVLLQNSRWITGGMSGLRNLKFVSNVRVHSIAQIVNRRLPSINIRSPFRSRVKKGIFVRESDMGLVSLIVSHAINEEFVIKSTEILSPH